MDISKKETLIAKWSTSKTPERLARIMLHLKNRNKLSEEMINQINEIGVSNERLMTQSFISFYLSTLTQESSADLAKSKVIKNILRKQNKIKNLDVVDLVNLSNMTNESDTEIISMAWKIFSDQEEDINKRLYVSNALLKQITFNPIFLKNNIDKEALMSIAIQSETNILSEKLLLLKTVALQCLKFIMNELSYDFYEQYYYKNIRAKLSEGLENMPVIKAVELSKLDKYLVCRHSRHEDLYSLLETLSIILYSGYNIDTSIFVHFESVEWHQELLVYVLLGKIIEMDPKGWTDIMEFMKQVQNLKECINKRFDKVILSVKKTENILKSLINKQNIFKYNIKQIINILIILQKQDNDLEILLDYGNHNFATKLVQMELLWLKRMCIEKDFKVKYLSNGNSELNILHRLTEAYDTKLINDILAKAEESSQVTDIRFFFNELNNSPLPDTQKYHFLSQLEPGSVTQWINLLLQLEIRVLLTSKFPDYLKYLNGELECNTSLDTKSLISKVFIKFKKSKKHESAKFIVNKHEETDGCINFGEEKVTMFYDEILQTEEKMAKLLSLRGWHTQRIAFLIDNIDSLYKLRELKKVIDIIFDFGLQEDDEIINIFKTSNTNDLTTNILQYAIELRFSGTFEKTVPNLMTELQELNENKNISFLKDIKKVFHEVLCTSDGNSVLFLTKGSIKTWNSTEICEWAKCYKRNIGIKIVPRAEKIAVILRAMTLASKHTPRSVQVMSVLIMLHPAEKKGRLAQINTGEGKTNIIAMIAAYHALQNYYVDIVTTSPVLAIPQSEELKEFYSLLDLTVSHNYNNPSGYKDNICYGPLTDFQADVLRDKCNNSGRRRGRNFDIVIVDEVDSMFIDGNDHIVMLSCDMPGMDHLETLLAAIVIQIDSVTSCIQEDDDGKTFFLQPKSRINDDGTLSNEENFEAVPLNCSKEKFIKDATESHIRKLVRDVEAEKGYPEVQIPNHLREFVCKIQIPKWINSAIRAKFVLENTKHYLLKKDKIMPIDAQNTGIVQQNMHWGNGTHQFLQIKHGAKLYPESLTNNYISNVGFFKRYGQRIYGLTGTLGNEKSTRFLEEVYEVDSVIIPPFKRKQHVELTPSVLNKKELWISEIVKNSISKLENGRVVLIITKFIKDIDELYDKFVEMNYNISKIYKFKTGDDVEVVERPFKPEEVILTTNIAGRGTDIKLEPSVNENGGLHVCLTFMPINTRVENQNTGRTSRTGNRGTSQLIIFNNCGQSISDIKKDRDRRQNDTIAGAERDIKVVFTKEKIFCEFLRLLDDIKGRNEHKRVVELVAVQERFAIWLNLEEDFIDKESESAVVQKFQHFKDSIVNDDKQSKLIQNPYFHNTLGKILLLQQSYKEAFDEFTLAIKLDKDFAEHAFYNRGYCLLANYGKNMSGNRYYIDDAIGDLKQARKLIQKRQDNLHLLQKASSSECFSEQVQHKMNLYNIQKQAIDLAIGPDTDEIDEQIKSLKQRLDSIPKNETKDINDLTDNIKNMENDRERIGVIEESRKKNRDIEIKLMALSDCLPENELECYKDEIEEFNRNGFVGGFIVSEIKPIDWKAVFGLMVIGLGQLIAGAALAVYTLGSGITFAMNLITEGISDLITAIKDGIINRDFSWASWAIQKAISITVSIICAGYSAMKDVASTASSGVKMLGKKVINETVKSGWKLVAKKVATELAKGVAKEIVSGLANYGLEKTLIPKIQSEIVENIKGPIQNALENNEYIKTMLCFDLENKTNKYENFIKSVCFEILDKTCKNKLLEISKQIAIGVADGKIKYFSAARKISEALSAVQEVRTCVPLFIEELNKRVEQKSLRDNLMNIKNNNETLDKETVNNERAENSHISRDAPKAEEQQNDININKGPEEQVKPEKQDKNKIITITKNLSKAVVSTVSLKMLATIKGKVVNPLVQTGLTYGMDKITSSLDSTLNNDIENYKALKRHIHYQDKGYGKNNLNNVPQSKAVINDINDNDPAVRKAGKIIEQAERGGKSGLPEMGAISDVIDRPIEVYDEKGRLKFTIGEHKKGEPVQVQHHRDREHYTVMGDREPFAQGKGGNMCLYNVISDQTGIHPDEIKSSSLNWMKANIAEFSKQSHDISRLEVYDSLKLCLGGAEYSGKDYKDAARYMDACEGKVGNIASRNAKYNPPPAHPRGHASKAGDPSSVEEYSKTDKSGRGKDGFNSYLCQDIVAHYALSHPKTQMELRKMNTKNTVYVSDSKAGNVTLKNESNIKNAYQVKVHLTEAELNLPNSQILRGGNWKNGQKVEDWKIKDVLLILRHQPGKANDPSAPVFIQTLYPVNPSNTKP